MNRSRSAKSGYKVNWNYSEVRLEKNIRGTIWENLA